MASGFWGILLILMLGFCLGMGTASVLYMIFEEHGDGEKDRLHRR